MSRKYRVLFLTIFSIFFVVVTPFLILYSLGYELDLSQRQIKNSLTISIDSRPRSADIYSGDSLLIRNSGELRADEQQLIPLSVREDGFIDEDFLIWSGENQNTTARITNLWLLPKESNALDSSENREFVSILSEDQLIFRENNTTYIQLYGFGGLQGNPEPIRPFGPLLGVSIDESMRWEKINETVFWSEDSELLLIQSNGEWRLHDTRFFTMNPVQIAYINPSQLMILDPEKNIWVWDHINNSFRFLDSGFIGLSYTEIPENIWLWKYDTIYRLNTNQISDQIQFEDTVYSQDYSLTHNFDGIAEHFVVKNVYQGVFLRLQSSIYYIPDYNKSEITLISDNVRNANAFDNSIIWLDQSNQIWVYNLQLQNIENVASIPTLESVPEDEINLFYYFLWRRILIYTPDAVYSIWFDKDILNKSINGYNPILWIDGPRCSTEMSDRHQFCIQDKNLIVFRNTSIW